MFKMCKECGKVTDHIVEALVTTCTNCYTAVDDDAEDLFGDENFIE
jgi:protein-arginine kinase activator protein McsA